jgi:hypothetical protein
MKQQNQINSLNTILGSNFAHTTHIIRIGFGHTYGYTLLKHLEFGSGFDLNLSR